MAETVYLIHLDKPLAHARHYIGTTDNLDARIEAHRNTTWECYPVPVEIDGHKHTGCTHGAGASFLGAVNAAGISWQVVRTWEGGRKVERWLKRWKKGRQLCPVCNPGRTWAKAQRKEKAA